jgi:hypothetical protein
MTMPKNFTLPENLGPCAKAEVKCTLIATDGSRFVGGNWCENPQPKCPRAPGEGYEKCKTICKQLGHAEEVARMLAGDKAVGARAYLEGHRHACENCQVVLFGAGVESLSIKAPPAESEVPADIHTPLNAIYQAVKGATMLLAQGRTWGIGLGMTEYAKKLLIAQHGAEAIAVLANCTTIKEEANA